MAEATVETRDLGRSLFSAEAAGFTAFAAVQAWLIFTHAPWIDEGQALLIARAPWSELLANLKYEGHPALWYLWLGLIDRLCHNSPWSLPVAQVPVSLGLLAFIWFRSPFPLAAKILLSLSYYFAFEYGVISRSYGLGALLLLTAVPLRGTVWGWLSLALAANTSVHAALAALVLGACFFGRRWSCVGVAVLGIGVTIALATVLPVAPDYHSTSVVPYGPGVLRFLLSIHRMSAAIVPSGPHVPYQWQALLPGSLGLLVGLAVLPLGLLALKEIRLGVGFAALYIALLSLSTLAYDISVRHAGVLFVYFIASLWTEAGAGRRLTPVAWSWLFLSAACGIPFIATAPVYPFTHSLEIASWIRSHNLEREIWGAWPGREGTMLSAEIGRETVNLEKECRNTFVRWNYGLGQARDPMLHIRAAGVRYVVSEEAISGGKLLTSFGVGGGWEWPVLLYEFPPSWLPRVIPLCD